MAAARARWRSRRWAIAGALSPTKTVSFGVLYYAFAAFLVPMQQDLGARARPASAVGLIVISQIPGRVLFAPLAARLAPAQSTSAAVALALAAIAIVVSAPEA